MQLRYGNYVHAQNEAAVRLQFIPQRSEGNQYYAYIARWMIGGMLQSDNQNDLIAAIATLEAGYSGDGGDLELIGNDGVTVAASLLSAACIGGTRMVGPIEYPQDGATDAEFSTFRRYQITVEGLVPTGTVEILAWAESIDFTGTGGPRNVFQQPLVGLPQKQQVAAITPVTVIQHGRAVGLTGYPTPPPPQWPADVKQDEIIIRQLPPKRYGPPGTPAYVEWEIQWVYPHQGLGPFIGFPTPWPT
jgi:hypothetical protein